MRQEMRAKAPFATSIGTSAASTAFAAPMALIARMPAASSCLDAASFEICPDCKECENGLLMTAHRMLENDGQQAALA